MRLLRRKLLLEWDQFLLLVDLLAQPSRRELDSILTQASRNCFPQILPQSLKPCCLLFLFAVVWHKSLSCPTGSWLGLSHQDLLLPGLWWSTSVIQVSCWGDVALPVEQEMTLHTSTLGAGGSAAVLPMINSPCHCSSWSPDWSRLLRISRVSIWKACEYCALVNIWAHLFSSLSKTTGKNYFTLCHAMLLPCSNCQICWVFFLCTQKLKITILIHD